MRNTAAKGALTLILSLTLHPGVVHAHSHTAPGEHVQKFQQHLGEYEQDVLDLATRLDAILADYEAGRDLSGRMDGFVDNWEQVRYHEAVENVTPSLYAPIWQGIGGLRTALDEGAPVAEARRWQRRLEGALWQGIGALKLAARSGMGAPGQAGRQAAGEGGPDTVGQIMANLDKAVSEYAEGRLAPAKTLIHDTYMQLFEGLEGELIERNPQLVVNLEEQFNATLPLLMERGAPAEEARSVVSDMKAALEEAGRLLDQAEAEKGSVF